MVNGNDEILIPADFQTNTRSIVKFPFFIILQHQFIFYSLCHGIITFNSDGFYDNSTVKKDIGSQVEILIESSELQKLIPEFKISKSNIIAHYPVAQNTTQRSF